MTISRLTLLAAFSSMVLLVACDNLPTILTDDDDGNGSTGGTSNIGNDDDDGFTVDDGGTDDDANGTGGSIIEAPPACGDGTLDEDEECDDSNGKPGDGCSGICTLEPGYICPDAGEDCILSAECGNHVLEISEQCDLGDAEAGGGCDQDCQIESGWSCNAEECVAVSTATCGDNLITPPETCEDGMPTPVSLDGCSDQCAVENGFTCLQVGQPCEAIVSEYCGNGLLAAGEECDDGNGDPGDGCSTICELEAGYVCAEQNEKCTVKCGDSLVIGQEACDDGNTDADDGCAADCLQVEAGYVCPVASGVGGDCQLSTPGAECPNSIIEFGEGCDDGNTKSGDGCTNCTIDSGYICATAGALCELIPFCGDGFVDIKLGEQCDDSDTSSSDGCSSTCQIEANYRCPVPTYVNNKFVGAQCVKIVCGDGAQQGSEQCDDHNPDSNDGCSSTCVVENGWSCPVNASCQASSCGDSLRAGIEDCDHGANNNGTTKVNGVICSSTCTYVADPTLCGNGGAADPGEGCDDGNKMPWDGCSTTCTKEPNCPKSGGACSSRCGDGMILPGDDEECDDGNTRNNDGCDAFCQVETGWACAPSAAALPDTWDVPVVFRDFNRANTATGVHHLDFETYGGSDRTANMVGLTLDATDGKPTYTGICQKGAQIGPCLQGDQTTGQTEFDQWYRTSSVNSAKVTTLPLTKQTGNSYAYLSTSLFPLDGQGFVASGQEYAHSNGHNYGFTSELRGWFTYGGGEKLDFSGDDDVWVFINGKLALDLGGMHPRRSGFVVLGEGGDAMACETVTLEQSDPHTDVKTCRNIGLVKGNVYEIALFHAERHSDGSNFNLTLSGFLKNPSVCTTVCGDGIKANVEQCDRGDICEDASTCVAGHCDDGTLCNDGSYGGCTKGPNKTTGCKLANFCGDAKTTNPPETCDNGLNDTLYTPAAGTGCSSGCVAAPYCGDTQVALGFEQCDGGAACDADCTLPPQCGDDTLDAGESCDDGALNGALASTCDTNCQLKCGNLVQDAGEQCDPGLGNFSSAYGGCLPQVGMQQGCLLGPHCGDGVPNGTEPCDDGKNDGTYGTCSAGCTLPPRCGDGVPQTTAGEVCDKGGNNIVATYVASGAGQCTKGCRPVGYCGDHAVTNGEVCDDGKNDGTPGSCTVTCSAWIPLVECGDGQSDAGEQCDNGTGSNGTGGNSCDAQCRLTCGNGIKDSGEDCDDGKNDGSYGSCKSTCKFAPYCGDDIKNGTETCDNGDGNLSNPYGSGKCTTSCREAPRCGDGRIDAAFGEDCDGQSGCTAACAWGIVR